MSLTNHPLFAGHARRTKTVAASSATTANPASNLLTPSYATEWRSSGAAALDVNIDLDYGAPVPIDLVGVIGSNATTSVERGIKFSSTTVGGSDLGEIALGAAHNLALAAAPYHPPWGLPIIALVSPRITARYVRIRLRDVSNPAGFLSACYAWAEEVFQLEEAHDSTSTPDDQFRPGSGGAPILRGKTFQFPRLSKAAAHEILAWGRTRVDGPRALFVPRPGRPETWPAEALWCELPSLPQIAAASNGDDLYGASITVREVDE